MSLRAAAALTLALATGCTISHSKQAMVETMRHMPGREATFVSEEDSGLSLLGVLTISEPDHYAVLIERSRQRYKCGEIHSMQLDYYTEYWIIVGFPIARMTAVCEPGMVATSTRS
jgi:hypothetical protein